MQRYVKKIYLATIILFFFKNFYGFMKYLRIQQKGI